MSNVKRSQLEQQVNHIAELTGNATTEAEAITKGLPGYLQLENNPTYGGYRLNMVSVQHGGHSAPLPGMSSTQARQKAGAFYDYLAGIIIGLEYSQPQRKETIRQTGIIADNAAIIKMNISSAPIELYNNNQYLFDGITASAEAILQAKKAIQLAK